MKLLRVDPNYFSFLSGIFAAVGINLVTGVLSTDQLPHRWPFIIASALLTVTASIAWAVLAWELTAIGRLAILEAPSFVKSDDAWNKLATAKRCRLLWSLGTALLSAMLGVGVLLFGY